MKAVALGAVKRLVKTAVSGAVGALLVLVIAFIIHLERRPDLRVWHEAALDAEFTAASPVESLEGYLALEQQLFAQLDQRVIQRLETRDRSLINRYDRGSLSDPGNWSPDWNRTFELATGSPRAGVLLLHGMSDAPYSLRGPGRRLHAAGAWVVGLRLPGHGTAPSGLVEVRWQDMAAAVRLAARDLRDKIGDRPLYIVGYSNGGALAVHYALSAQEDPTLPRVDGLVLISPAIGVTRLAALAVWQARVGHMLGLDKLAWNAIRPEYDPFKYGSFAVNAGDQTYRLTAEIQSRLDAARTAGRLDRFPPVLAFQSAVDATVSTRALVQGLFARLPPSRNELVLFDINRLGEVEHVLVADPKADIDAMFADPALAFSLSLVTNENGNSRRVIVRRKRSGDSDITEASLGLAWPRGLYSLSHVALPFSEDDPVYGAAPFDGGPGIHLGRMDLRGERGVLQIPASEILRLRWNPFYPYVEARLLEFLRLTAP